MLLTKISGRSVFGVRSMSRGAHYVSRRMSSVSASAATLSGAPSNAASRAARLRKWGRRLVLYPVLLSLGVWWSSGTSVGYAGQRIVRDGIAVMSMVMDYRQTLRESQNKPEEEQKVAKEAFHQRSAAKLRDLFLENGGIYIKLGQHLSQLQYLLPDAYVEAMLVTLDRAPTSDYQSVCQVFVEEFGCLPTEKFASFDPVPIASASLAQVHRALTKDGTQVAVKVQHQWLKDSVPADLLTVEFFVKALHWMFPEFDYQWLVDETKLNLPQELNFLQEGKNAERCSKNFKHRDDVQVPQIEWQHTSPRVLTMEFVQGVQLTDIKGLAALQISLTDVSSIVSQVFSEQIFLHGFIHCDPHPGNVLIQRYKGTNKPKLILLDHGLYREIDDEFRLNYSELWKSIIFKDVKGIEECSRKLNVPELYPMLAAMLTHKEWSQVIDPKLDSIKNGSSRAELERLRGNVVQYSQQIAQVLATVPRPMLLLLKTNDCLHGIDHRLGTPINTYLIMGRYCTKSVHQERIRRRPSFRTRVEVWVEWLRLEFRLSLFQLISWLKSIWISSPAITTSP